MLADINLNRRKHALEFLKSGLGTYIAEQLKSAGKSRNPCLKRDAKKMYNRELVRYMLFK